MEQSSAGTGALKRSPASGGRHRWFRATILIATVMLLLAVGFLAYRAWSGRQESSAQPSTDFLSASELEARHGLAVRLIGVTAAGGMIDFRLKILDADKARRFLEDPAHLPRLVVAKSGEALMVSEGLDEDVEFEDGGILFNFFPNDGGVVESGTPVIVEFGSIRLEPIEAQ